MTKRQVKPKDGCAIPQDDNSEYTKFTVDHNGEVWWVQVKDMNSDGLSARYAIWDREGQTEFLTEFKAVSVLLEWIVHRMESGVRAQLVAAINKTP